MNKLSPILLFTYKRLDILKETVKSLQGNYLASESELFIFSDAAKSEKDKIIVESVREYLKTIIGFKNVIIHEAATNKGLANSIIDGVKKIINIYGKVIVLEDDLKTTPNFLSYMNACLDKYENDERVFSISGYSFNLGMEPQDANDVYFLNRGWSWGWATWKERWDKVDWLVKDYPDFLKDKNAQKEFAKGGSDVNVMLEKQMEGKSDSWAIRWFFHQFRIKGLTVYPILSKVYNNGFDNYATHTTGSSKRYLPTLDKKNNIRFVLPAETGISTFYQRQFQRKMGIKARAISKIETLFKRVAIFTFK